MTSRRAVLLTAVMLAAQSVVSSSEHQTIDRQVPLPYDPSGADPVHAFAEKLSLISVYTSEEETLAVLVDAEIELLASRWLAAKLMQGGGARDSWDERLRMLRKAVEPVARAHLPKRAQALKQAELDGREPFVREVKRLVRSPRDRGEIYVQGARVSSGGNQIQDIPEILAFHQQSAAAKWRRLWPELRAHAARLAALDYQIDADAALGTPELPWEKRAAALAGKVGGRVLNERDWRSMAEGRLGFTLSGLDRFLLPLGTEMRPGTAGGETTTIAERGDAILISRREGSGLVFRLLDARWEREVEQQLSPDDLETVDRALTATYSEAKGRLFAPLELEWDAYLNLARQLRTSRHMQELYQSFARESASAMQRAWGP